MRFFPVLSALVVSLLVYAFVMERDALRAIAGASPEPAATVAQAAPEPPAEAASVVVLRSQARSVQSEAIIRGRTEAARRVEVRAETTGLVAADPPRRGATVAAGDLLCRLDPGARLAELAGAEARLLEAQANERAAATLAEQGFSAETTALAGRAALQVAQAEVEAARRELDRLEIRAPFAGVLEDDAAELGSLLQPGSPCGTVIALDPIRLTGFVPETTVGSIALGTPATARLQTGETLTATVTFVARASDPETRTFRVDAEAPNPDLSVRDGVTAEIRVPLAAAPAHLVPQSALTLDDQGRLGLRLAVEGRARFVPVRPVRDDASGFWVAGLPERAEIIVVGQDFVTDGDPVRVTYRNAAP